MLDAGYLDQLADRTIKMAGGNQPVPYSIITLIVTLILFVAILSYLLYRLRHRLRSIKQEMPEGAVNRTTREDVETFIKENLAQASLKSIAERFQTNNAVIYELLAPEKPGAYINRLRMVQVRRLRKENKSAKEISQLTGFSEYYVRKVWNKKVG